MVTPPWPSLVQEGVEHLTRMLRVDTTNPPGNELELARYLAAVMETAGIGYHIVEPVPGRAALIARLRGNGRKKPLLMTAHMDVVGVERSEWSADPFGAEIRDGYVYGRGAIDDKGMLAAELVALLALQRRYPDAAARDRDVIFAATADEESGGDLGLGWLIENHPDLIRAELAINEGGRIRIVDGRPLYAAIQTAEKVSNVVQVLATGPAGHASVPLAGNAVARLGRAIAKIADHREPLRLLPTTREFFMRLGRVWPHADEARAMLDVASGEAGRMQAGEQVLARVPLFDAVLRSGISPTVVQGGVRHNVIPAHAGATLSVRTLPGDPVDDVARRLRDVVADSQVEITVTDRGVDAPASELDGPGFRALRDAIHALDPAIVTVPYLSTGATESAKLRAWGVQTYGVLPFPMDENDERRMHGADERLSLSAFEFGIRLLLSVLERTVPAESKS